MPANRPACRWLRIALAVVFGFMTLGHGPIMTFAHAGQHGTASVSAPTHHDHGHQHHGHAHPVAGDEHHGVTGSTDQPSACNAFGCFITVAAIAIAERQPVLLPIGKLRPAPLPAGTPDAPEPADPPPRLHI